MLWWVEDCCGCYCDGRVYVVAVVMTWSVVVSIVMIRPVVVLSGSVVVAMVMEGTCSCCGLTGRDCCSHW